MKASRWIGVTVLVVLLVVTVWYTVGWVWKPKEKELPTVEIGTFSKALSYAPLYVAKHFNWFESDPVFEGRKVVFKTFNDRPTISTALTTKELQLVFCAEIPAIVCVAQGNDIRIVQISSTASQKVLVRVDSGIKEPKELQGKKVAVLQATSSHYGLLKILKLAGLTEKDVAISYMPPNEARAAFESKQIDAWAVWAPFGEQEEVSGVGTEIGGEGAWIHSIMAVPVYLMADNPSVVWAATQIIQRGKEWVVANPEEARRIVAQEMGLDIAVVDKAWPKFNWNPSLLSDELVNDFQQKADFLAQMEKTRQGKSVDVRSRLVDTRYVAR